MDYNLTPLCALGYKYGTDKCPQIKHAYTPFYYQLLQSKRQEVKKVLEIGVGLKRKNRHIPERVYELGIAPFLNLGASLYMWRDFFPNAQIFGADYVPEAIFEDERIKTFLCDTRKEEDLKNLIKNTGSDIDVVFDDASHRTDDQIFAAITLLPILQKSVTYIIEDVTHSKLICQALDKIGDFDYLVPPIYRKWHGGMILVIRNKNQENKL
jgi:hypothetical protein